MPTPPGVPGLVLGKLGFHVTVTDKDVALPLIQDNIERNRLASVCSVCRGVLP